jgi:sugar phosphate isomerase/epimerase
MPPRIGLQLYTVRDAIAEDLPGTLERVAAMGYRGVETAFFGDVVPPEAPALLRDLGLEVFAAHTNLPLGEDADAALRAAELLGAPRLVWHGWPRDDRYDTRDGIMQLAGEFNRAGRITAAHGRVLAIHNHWWECEEIDGEPAWRIFLAELDPGIGFELDAYWATFAGADAAAVAAEMGNRLMLLHLKDGPIARHEPMTALGTGRMDIPPVLATAADHPAWVVVELDEVAGDPFAAVAESRDSPRGLGLPD